MRREMLDEAGTALLAEPVIATLATVAADGTPHLTPVWVDVDGGDIVVNTAEGRAKLANLRRSPSVAVCVVDPHDPYRVLAIQGHVVEISEQDADAHIDRLASKYLGVDTYPMRRPGERRLKVRIRPDRILMQPAG